MSRLNDCLGIVITYKETEKTTKAIKSLYDDCVDIVLVFNGWDDCYQRWLNKVDNYIDYKFLNKENVGFCEGNNQGMRLAIKKNYKYVFLLNNDAWIEKDCIEELIKVCEKNEKIGLAQPKVYKAWNRKVLDTTGLIFRYGNQYSWKYGLGYVVDRGFNEYDEGQYDNKVNIIGCCACSVLYKVEMLKHIGLFWNKLWMSCEDVELSWRAWKFGWKAIYVPTAVSYHWRGYTKTIVKKYERDNKDLKTLLRLISYRNWVLTLLRYGSLSQRTFTALMWKYFGGKLWIGKRLNRNEIGGYYIWLCSLALLSRYYRKIMEKEFNELFKKSNIRLIY